RISAPACGKCSKIGSSDSTNGSAFLNRMIRLVEREHDVPGGRWVDGKGREAEQSGDCESLLRVTKSRISIALQAARNSCSFFALQISSLVSHDARREH